MREYDITLTCDHCHNEEHIMRVKAKNIVNANKRAIAELGFECGERIAVYKVDKPTRDSDNAN